MELRCPECHKETLTLNPGTSLRCPCKRRIPFELRAWPALQRATATPAPALRAEDEAACFHHPHRTAVAVCEDCGKLICAWCETSAVADTALCLSCYAQRQQDPDPKPQAQTGATAPRPLYDNIAMILATLPAVLVWPSLVCAPVAVYFALRHWKKHPTSRIVPRSRWRYIVALVFAVPQCVAWAVFWLHAALNLAA